MCLGIPFIDRVLLVCSGVIAYNWAYMKCRFIRLDRVCYSEGVNFGTIVYVVRFYIKCILRYVYMDPPKDIGCTSEVPVS